MNEVTKKNKIIAVLLSSPLRLLVVLSIGVFIVEFVIMAALQYFFAQDLMSPAGMFENITDALILIIVLFPALHFLALEPLISKRNEELRESEERFRKIFENGQYGIILTGIDFTFLKVNPVFCRITGYTEEELLKKKFPEITHPANIRADIEAGQKLMRGEISSYQTEKRYIQKGGGEVWVSLIISVIWSEDGSFKYFLGMVEDITERKRTEAERETQMKELKDMNNLMVNREMKMVELKKEIEELKKKVPGN